LGLSSCITVHARNCDGSYRGHDQRKAASDFGRAARRLVAGLIATSLPGTATAADPIRVATFNVELSREGPGLLLRDILKGEDTDILLASKIVAHVAPDVLVLTGFDYDHGGHALAAFADLVGSKGHRLPFRYASAPNSGMQTAADLDGDGRINGPRDAYGYGEFAGQGGMAILSRLEILDQEVRDFSHVRWAELPNAMLAATEHADLRRLSSVGHWQVPMALPEGGRFDLLAWHATPPVFDGPEDLNGRRNHDEAMFWLRLISGGLQFDAPAGAFVLAGDANLDPNDGEGRADALLALFSDPNVQDPLPSSDGGAEDAIRDGGANAKHVGAPRLDTVDWRDGTGDPGNLRVDYVLPSSHWRVENAGVFWPASDHPDRHLLGDGGNGASRHRLVWVDLVLQR
jgi:hypothetical protein